MRCIQFGHEVETLFVDGLATDDRVPDDLEDGVVEETGVKEGAVGQIEGLHGAAWIGMVVYCLAVDRECAKSAVPTSDGEHGLVGGQNSGGCFKMKLIRIDNDGA
ncbi:hypothetical protein KC349_g65 [Hortaea werneckii]|nr:hypothetical protein KC349_g65 [Hortaea werneckii]